MPAVIARTRAGLLVVVGVLAFFANPQTGRSLTLPDDLQEQLREVHGAWKEKRIRDLENLTRRAIPRLYAWFEHAFGDAEITELIETARAFVQVKVLEPKSHLRADGTERAAVPITLHVYRWRGEAREVVVLQADGVWGGWTDEDAYTRSKPPILLAKEGRTIVSSGAGEAEVAFAPGSYEYAVGFLAGPSRNSWPDVLITCMSSGRSTHASFDQRHLVLHPTAQWKTVWEHGDPGPVYVDFDAATGRLRCRDDLGPLGTWRLVHGETARQGE